MMCVIVHDGNACYFAFVLETAVCASKASKPFDGYLIRDLKKLGQRDCCQCVGYVMAARNLQIKTAGLFAILQDSKGNYLKVVGADGTYSERIVYAESSGCEDNCKSTPVFGTHNVSVYGDVTIEIDLLICDSCGNDDIFTICTDVTVAKPEHPMVLTNFFEICVPNSTETVFLPRFTEFCNSSCEARLATNNCGRDLSVDNCGQVTGNILVAICLTCEKKIVAPVQLCVLSTGYLNAPTQQHNITCSFPSLFPSELDCCRNNLCEHNDDECCEPCEPCKSAECEKPHRPMPRR